MAKRWAISREANAFGGNRPGDWFMGNYDSREDALQNAAQFSLDHDCVEVTVFEAIETVKAKIPSIITKIEDAVTEAVQP